MQHVEDAQARAQQGGCTTLPPPKIASVKIKVDAKAEGKAPMAAEKRRKKVRLAPGFSQMDWVRLTQRAKNMNGLGGAAPKPRTLKEVAEHGSKYDAWMAIHGKVYDVTKYIPYHPGGVDELLRGVGKDATALFDEIHSWVSVEGMLRSCYVGDLIADAGPVDKIIDIEKWQAFCLAGRMQLGEDMWLLRFKLPKGESLAYSGAGWHVEVTVDGIMREYTIVSSSLQRGSFDLAVKPYPRVEKSVASKLCKLPVGEKVSMRGPFGNTIVRFEENGHDGIVQVGTGGEQVKATRIVMLAAGSGITPYIQVIRQWVEAKSTCGLVLLYSCKSLNAFAFKRHLDALSSGKGGNGAVLNVEYFVTDEASPPEEHHKKGMVQSRRIQQHDLKKIHRAKETGSDAWFVCGPSTFEDCMRESLSALSVPGHCIFRFY
eukprot:g3565.t1